MVKVQKWLDQNYPKKTRLQIKGLDISENELRGSLKLVGFTNLERLLGEEYKQNFLVKN